MGYIQILQFSLIETASGDNLLTSQSSIVKLESVGVRQLLADVSEKRLQLIKQSEFSELCRRNGVSEEDVLHLLKGVFRPVHRQADALTLKLHTDLTSLEAAVEQVARSFDVNIATIDSASKSIVHVIFGRCYDESIFRRIYEASNPSDVILTAHLLHGKLFIDGLYQKKLGLPCHFCHRYYHINAAADRFGVKQDKWWQFLSTINPTGQSLGEPMSYELNALQESLITSAVAYRLRDVFDSADISYAKRPGSFVCYDLTNGDRTSGMVPHSPVCGCIMHEW